MPLLGDAPFCRKKLTVPLYPDSSVFVCEATCEAFTSYDEYFERALQATSMVWSCSITKKSNLTFKEAIESEAQALALIDSFSPGLQRALIYLTHEVIQIDSHFNDICYFLWSFAYNRYFIGEEVEVQLGVEGSRKAKVIRVIPPSEALIKTLDHDVCFGVDPNLFKYAVIVDGSHGQIVVTADKISRPGQNITKSKVNLFIKQHVVTSKRLKETRVLDASIEKFLILDLDWTDVFAGPTPNFDSEDPSLPTNMRKQTNKERKKYSSPKELGMVKSTRPGPKPMTPEERKARQEAREMLQKAKKMAKKEEKQRQKQMLVQDLQERKKKRDDLECDDLKPLPPGIPILSTIPNEYIGDLIMFCEFFNNFQNFFDLKDEFPKGLSFKGIETALTEKSIKSEFGDLIKITLATIICLEDEAPSKTDEEETDVTSGSNVTNDESINAAIKSARVSWAHFRSLVATTFSSIPIDTYNLTELTRIVIETSGGSSQCRRPWRHALLQFKMDHPGILDKLSSLSLFDLEPVEKLLLLEALVQHVMSFPAFREKLEESFEESSELKRKIRQLKSEFIAWDKENAVKRPKRTKNSDGNIPEPEDEKASEERKVLMEKYKTQRQQKQQKLDEQVLELQVQLLEAESRHNIRCLGLDRAYRRYWVFNSIPGLFVEHDDPFSGQCNPIATPRRSGSPSSSPFNNKENECISLTHGKHHSQSANDALNGQASGAEVATLQFTQFDTCTADENCNVHTDDGSVDFESRWRFYADPRDVDRLIDALNPRGFREIELKETISVLKDYLKCSILDCPVNQLNEQVEVDLPHRRRDFSYPRKTIEFYRKAKKLKFTDKEPVISHILSFVDRLARIEEQFFHSGILSRTYSTDSRLTLKESLEKIEETFESFGVLRSALHTLGSNVQATFIHEKYNLTKWLEAVAAATSMSQLFFYLELLENFVNWDLLSTAGAYCKICKKTKGANDVMLRCDECKKPHHFRCIDPPLEVVPTGEWYCVNCTKARSKPKSPVKKRIQETEEEEEEVEEEDNENDEDEDATEDEAMDAESDDEDSYEQSTDEFDDDDTEVESGNEGKNSYASENDPICVICKTDDAKLAVVACSKCDLHYHNTCHRPEIPLGRRSALNNFVCSKCNPSPSKSSNTRERRKVTFNLDSGDVEIPPKRQKGIFTEEKNTNHQKSNDNQTLAIDSSSNRRGRSGSKTLSDFDSSACMEVLKHLKQQESAWPFLGKRKTGRSTRSESQDKMDIDLVTLTDTLQNGGFGANSEFVKAVNQMFATGEARFKRTSDERKALTSLSKSFQVAIARHLPGMEGLVTV